LARRNGSLMPPGGLADNGGALGIWPAPREEEAMKHSRMILVVLTAALALEGCAKAAKDLLPEAVFAADMVPVYKNCELRDMMGSESWGDEPDSYTKGQAWFLNTKATKDELVAFYEKAFPNAPREVMDDGAITFHLTPEGAKQPYEYVEVTVRDGEIQVGESFQPQRQQKKKSVE
jgi:hypothetical protein